MLERDDWIRNGVFSKYRKLTSLTRDSAVSKSHIGVIGKFMDIKSK